ncbi:hypothetical protein LBMAG38_16370 [Chloroflexota bacterium]|nr:hypothetical protein LBMAG38_16370 [Chloroflexota bacterium]
MLTKVDSKVAEAARTRELRARRATGDACAIGVAVTVVTDIVGEAEAYAGTAVASFLGAPVANAKVGDAASAGPIDGVPVVDAPAADITAVVVTATAEGVTPTAAGTDAVGRVVVRMGNSSPDAPRRSTDPATSALTMRRAEAIRRKWSTAFRVMSAFNRLWLLTI